MPTEPFSSGDALKYSELETAGKLPDTGPFVVRHGDPKNLCGVQDPSSQVEGAHETKTFVNNAHRPLSSSSSLLKSGTGVLMPSHHTLARVFPNVYMAECGGHSRVFWNCLHTGWGLQVHVVCACAGVLVLFQEEEERLALVDLGLPNTMDALTLSAHSKALEIQVFIQIIPDTTCKELCWAGGGGMDRWKDTRSSLQEVLLLEGGASPSRKKVEREMEVLAARCLFLC